jgi:hypothetical protein
LRKGSKTSRNNQHVIRSWLELAQLAERLAGEEWIFRGEHSDEHELRPGAGRLSAEIARLRKAPFTQDEERAALARFKDDALPYLRHTPPRDHDLEWLGIAQHHGMQTRLLDWTESLLIAAFFAVESGGAPGAGIIYGVHGLPVVAADADPFSVREVSVYRPSHLTPRIAPQWSIFTVHPHPGEDFRRSDKVTEWRIPGEENCWQIKLVLDSCGINYASIYPDLSGLARHIYWRYKWGMGQTKLHRHPGAKGRGRSR